MKYTISINQVGIVDAGLHEKTDLADWAILEHIYDWQRCGRAQTMGKMAWINFANLMKDLPLLGLKSKGGVSKRIHKLEDLGLLEIQQSDDHRLFACTTQKYQDVVIYRAPKSVSSGKHPLNSGNGGVSSGKHSLDNNPPDYKLEDKSAADADGKPSPQEALFPETETSQPVDPPKENDLEKSARATIFSIGVKLLTSQGTREGSARSFLGKWAGVDEDRLAAVISQCALREPADARAYIARAMKGGGKITTIEQAKKAAAAENVPIRKGDTFEHLRDRIYQYREERLSEETEKQAEGAT